MVCNYEIQSGSPNITLCTAPFINFFTFRLLDIKKPKDLLTYGYYP